MVIAGSGALSFAAAALRREDQRRSVDVPPVATVAGPGAEVVRFERPRHGFQRQRGSWQARRRTRAALRDALVDLIVERGWMGSACRTCATGPTSAARPSTFTSPRRRRCSPARSPISAGSSAQSWRAPARRRRSPSRAASSTTPKRTCASSAPRRPGRRSRRAGQDAGSGRSWCGRTWPRGCRGRPPRGRGGGPRRRAVRAAHLVARGEAPEHRGGGGRAVPRAGVAGAPGRGDPRARAADRAGAPPEWR